MTRRNFGLLALSLLLVLFSFGIAQAQTDVSAFTPQAILNLNVNYWQWYTDHTNSVAIQSYNVALKNWASNDPFFVSKNLPHPKPDVPMILNFSEATFRDEWNEQLGKQNFDLFPRPGVGNAFTYTAYVPPPPPLPVKPGPQVGPMVGPCTDAGICQTTPVTAAADLSDGTLVFEGGLKYVYHKKATPFGASVYFEKVVQ
jgi:hypothetical protein